MESQSRGSHPDAGALDQGGERVAWEHHQVTLTRVPGYGFGIAVSGGRDNPHFANGDPAIAISDVLKAGPAEGRLQVNDRIVSANGVSLENVEYATAVQVLRDSGNTVQLAVRRRVALGQGQEPQTLKLCLTKQSKKDDFGIVLGCKIYVRELAETKDGRVASAGGLQEGDVLLKINNHSTDSMTLKEARKLLESAKDKLNLVVRREYRPSMVSLEPTHLPKDSHGNLLDGLSGVVSHNNNNNYSTQNLYVQPPTRHPDQEAKSNLLPRSGGRSRGPLMDPVSLGHQLDRPATPPHSRSRSGGGLDEGLGDLGGISPPRPPPPRPEDYYSSRRQLFEEDPLMQRSKHPMPDPRFITFQKDGSVGIRLTGGNEAGIFVTAVQPGSPASLQGLQPGDKILKVNGMDMKGATREEAVLFLLSLHEQIDLIVQHRREEYEQIVAAQRGDSFHVKAHFNYEQPTKGELSFRKGDVFHVVDTLHNGVVGSWQVYRIGRNNQEVQKGIIPNKARAEELATAQFNATKKELSSGTGCGGGSSGNGESRGSFFRRRRGSHGHRRSKSLGREHWDDLVLAETAGVSKFPAYERVVLRHPGFVRPVVLFGPVADLAREKLLDESPEKFTSPQLDNPLEDTAKSQKSSGIIRLSAIRDIMERGKHALLDVTPTAVDRLNYAQFYPIVIFLRAENKHIIKQLRAGLNNPISEMFPWSAHKSSKKLLEQCQKLEKLWSHTFTSTVTLNNQDSWLRKVRELIDKHQTGPVWMSETKPEEALSDDFLFPMTSRLSYASSPESDLDLSPTDNTGTHTSSATTSATASNTNSSTTAAMAAAAAAAAAHHHHYLHHHQSNSGRMVKSSSDPSIATVEDVVITGSPGTFQGAPPPYSPGGNNPYSHLSKQNYESTLGLASEHMLTPSSSGGMPPKRSGHHGFSSPGNNGSDDGPVVTSSTMNLSYAHHHHHHPGARHHQHQLSSPAGYPVQHPQTPRMINGGVRSPLAHSPPPPELPPRIDRSNKPPPPLSRLGGGRNGGSSAAERLFGGMKNSSSAIDSEPPNYINATPVLQQQQHRRGASLERGAPNHPPNKPSGSSYDSVSSSYDSSSYNNTNNNPTSPSGPRLGPNAHDDLKNGCITMGSPRGGPPGHDPYRFTRSTAQPINNNNTNNNNINNNNSDSSPGKPSPNKHHEYNKYRPSTSEYVTKPPGSYKPVPPPKPKNYRPSQMSSGSRELEYSGAEMVGHRASPLGGPSSGVRMDEGHQNGTTGLDELMNGGGGFDSGHGSSLDRASGHYTSSSNSHGTTASPRNSGAQFYYNVNSGVHRSASQSHHSGASSAALDLANRAEQRGSAFELYKKPSTTTNNSSSNASYSHHYALDTNIRVGDSGCPSTPSTTSTTTFSSSTTSTTTSTTTTTNTTPSNGAVHHPMTDMVRGTFTETGGTLHSKRTGVSLVIPPGALPSSSQQEIYFKVCPAQSGENAALFGPGYQPDEGETLMSPLVLCGPHGLNFRVPVELRLPHWASRGGDDDTSSTLSFAVKATPGGGDLSWRDLAHQNGQNNTNETVSVLVDHF